MEILTDKKRDFLIISHKVDNDGYASAAIADSFIKEIYRVKKLCDSYTITHMPWNYGMDVPEIEEFDNYTDVWLLDLHFPHDITHKLYEKYGNNFVWIDHHAKCVNDYYAEYPNDVINGIQPTEPKKTGIIANSAAELCWYFCHGSEGTNRYPIKFNGILQNEIKNIEIFELPFVIKLISDYDTWNNEDFEKWNELIYPFQMGSRINIASHEDMIKFFNDCIAEGSWFAGKPEGYIKEIIDKGKTIIDYEKMECNKDIKFGMMSHDFEFNGKIYKACVLNTTKRSSNVFVNMKDRDDYDVFICWNMILKGKKPLYKYSMYAFKDEVNCAGMNVNGLVFNGHPHATGGELDRYIF